MFFAIFKFYKNNIFIFNFSPPPIRFHNYHHAFPWDYSASELGPLDVFNPCTALINLFAYMGWAWDLKRVNPVVLDKKVSSTGDPQLMYQRGKTIWEWSTGLMVMFASFVLFYTIHFTYHNVL